MILFLYKSYKIFESFKIFKLLILLSFIMDVTVKKFNVFRSKVLNLDFSKEY